MGTRGLLGLIIKSQRHASYNHCDSYPTGLGEAIVQFILSLKPEEYAWMIAQLEKIVVCTMYPSQFTYTDPVISSGSMKKKTDRRPKSFKRGIPKQDS
jgi:hypothetical protein